MGDLLGQICLEVLGLIIGRKLEQSFSFRLPFLATAVLWLGYILLDVIILGTNESMMWLGICLFLVSPVLVLVFAIAFTLLGTEDVSRQRQLVHFVGTCSVPLLILLLVSIDFFGDA